MKPGFSSIILSIYKQKVCNTFSALLLSADVYFTACCMPPTEHTEFLSVSLFLLCVSQEVCWTLPRVFHDAASPWLSTTTFLYKYGRENMTNTQLESFNHTLKKKYLKIVINWNWTSPLLGCQPNMTEVQLRWLSFKMTWSGRLRIFTDLTRLTSCFVLATYWHSFLKWLSWSLLQCSGSLRKWDRLEFCNFMTWILQFWVWMFSDP